VEAWGDFLPGAEARRANCRSRAGYDQDSHRDEFYRLVAIAARALQHKGVPAAELPDHVIALNVGNIITVITRPDASPMRNGRVRAHAIEARGFKILLGSGRELRRHHVDVDVRQGRRGLFCIAAAEISPFDRRTIRSFFYTARFGDFISKPLSAYLAKQRGHQHDPWC